MHGLAATTGWTDLPSARATSSYGGRSTVLPSILIAEANGIRLTAET